jgi:hypothetical protein
MVLGGMIDIQGFMKISAGVNKLGKHIYRCTDTQTVGGPISLLLFFKNKESRLEIGAS